MVSRFALAIVALFAAGSVDARPDQPRDQAAPALTAPSHRVSLTSGETLTVEDGIAILRSAGGATLARNARIARRPDPGGACLTDGFRSIEVVGDGFAVRNQLCSGWFFILEVVTFGRTNDGYRLTRFSAEYIDRRTAEPDGPPRVLTEAKLGTRRFEDLDPDDLYPLFE